MKKVILFVVAIVSCGLLYAQQTQESKKAIQDKLREYDSRYGKSKHDKNFMQEYMKLLSQGKKYPQLEKVADEYLQMLSKKKRYSGENIPVFQYIKDYNAVSFREIINSWDKMVKPEDREKITSHVEKVYSEELFYSEINKRALPDDFEDCMRKDLLKINSPSKDFYLPLLDMKLAAEKEDVDKIIELVENYLVKADLKYWKDWTNAAMIGKVFGVVLEKSGQEEVEQVIGLLKPLASTEEKTIVHTLLNNFQGKLEMLNFDKNKNDISENKTLKQIENKEGIIDGFHFNTSVGGVMTDKEYRILCEVFSSNNDTLKQKHLRMVRQVFRYNGYTEGLDALKPLIEKNVKEGKEKEETLACYDKYEHLAPGKSAPEFRLKDLDGKEHALSDYRGKVVVVDVWATWCGGCIEKLPYFLKTREHFNGEKDVVFLVISIDNKGAYNKWKYSHPRYNLMNITSLIAHPKGCSFSDDYNITGIPRYFVIDREGKIVNVYAYAPDDARLEELIKETIDSGK